MTKRKRREALARAEGEALTKHFSEVYEYLKKHHGALADQYAIEYAGRVGRSLGRTPWFQPPKDSEDSPGEGEPQRG